MSLVFTMPGKLGDALHQFPIVAWHHRQTGERATLWLDEKTLAPLVNLFASQPCVEGVELKPGITSWSCGGQPWNFGLSTEDHLGHQIVHLGFRQFPTRQITLEVLSQIPLKVTPEESEACLVVTPRRGGRRCVLHGTFMSHQSGTPNFWKLLAAVADDLEKDFAEIVFTGTPDERSRALELYPSWTAFDDGGDFLPLAEFMAGADLVLASGSSGAALAGVLGVPCVRVHDPIGEAPKVIWSNLGERQWNLTEFELRSEWAKIREEVKEPQTT